MSGESSWSWASDWRCPKCGETQPLEPGQDTRPIREAHTCDPLALRRAERDESTFAIEVDEHECVFVEEQEPSGRLILPPCLVCGLPAMDALGQLRGGHEAVARVEALVGDYEAVARWSPRAWKHYRNVAHDIRAALAHPSTDPSP